MMDVILLKFRALFLFTLLLPAAVKAQDPRFIYIQTENKQPFYVKLDKKYLSSSATGYIIIAKLTAGTYQLRIGFPKNEWPELQVAMQVKEVNAGYLLKRSGDRNWGLVNLQTMETVPVQKLVPVNNEPQLTVKGDEFSKVLAEVVNDPSINQVPVVKKDAEPLVATTVVKKEEIVETVKAAVAVAATNEVLKPVSSKLPAAVTSIAKLAKDSTSGGTLITYIDKSETSNDTIKIFFPATPVKLVLPAEKSGTVRSDTRFIDMELQNPNSKTDSGEVKKGDLVITEKKKLAEERLNEKPGITVNKADTAKALLHAACKQTATQNDFLKLRRQMAAEDNEKNMTKAAGKQFILICFTSEQIRNLGVMYITEDERYKFYVTAFASVADRQNFGSLEDQLSDIYYKTRFRAMLSR